MKFGNYKPLTINEFEKVFNKKLLITNHEGKAFILKTANQLILIITEKSQFLIKHLIKRSAVIKDIIKPYSKIVYLMEYEPIHRTSIKKYLERNNIYIVNHGTTRQIYKHLQQ